MPSEKTLGISSETFERFDWYRTAFDMTSDELLSHFMDKLGLDDLETIQQHKKVFRTAKVEGTPT